MAGMLPALRRNIELMPSPIAGRPGLLVRDPFRYSDAVLVIPPPLVACLTFFDGAHEEGDLREALVRATGDLRAGEVIEQLRSALGTNGFLDDAAFATLRDERHQAFAAAEVREAAHAGSAYPDDEPALRRLLDEKLAGSPARRDVLAIAAPHVSYDGGWSSYRAAYAALGDEQGDRTFVVLGTSHYGRPDHFALTRKPYETPFGRTSVDREAVDALAASGGEAVHMEDYCHAVEHSVEFQVVCLQHRFGAGVRVLPVLCGPFARATADGGPLPEEDEGVARFLEALRALGQQRAGGLTWVLGIDMAHMGRRYGDPFRARAHLGTMTEVAARDQERLARIVGGDAEGFWRQVQRRGDDLKWCGSSPLYTFLRAAPPCRGEVLHYEQWNIDEHSVVSFAGLAFRAAA